MFAKNKFDEKCHCLEIRRRQLIFPFFFYQLFEEKTSTTFVTTVAKTVESNFSLHFGVRKSRLYHYLKICFPYIRVVHEKTHHRDFSYGAFSGCTSLCFTC